MVPQAKSDIKTLVPKFSALTKKEKLGYNEANTANVFIRPLFENLEWDFSDLDEVEAEKAIVKGRVDYLFKLNKASKLCSTKMLGDS
jgi:predicted type IV restriction endonuclease